MENFTITAPWQSRAEEPDQIARRIRSLLARLRPIAPELSRWYSVISDDNMPELDGSETWLADVVAADVVKGDLGEPFPYLGYMPNVTNVPSVFSNRVADVLIGIHAGSRMENRVVMGSGNQFDLPPWLFTFSVVKETILALSHTFEPLWSEAGPDVLRKDMVMSRYKDSPVITPCWMIHLSPPLARRIAPPPGIVGERHDDGSLFLSVTDQTFDPQNSEHVEGAHRLFTVLDTLQEKLPREQWLS